MITIKMPNPDKLFDGLDKRSLALVKVRAQNALAAKAKTLANRVTRERYTVKADALRNAMYVRKAVFSDPVATLVVTGRRIPLSKFRILPATPNPKSQRRRAGTKVQEVRSSPLTPKPGAFTARMASGHVGVFWRSKDKRMRKNAKRAALVEISGPDAPGMVNSKTVMARLRQLVHDESEVIYKRELAFELSKATATVRIG
jgi:hypothetical protein